MDFGAVTISIRQHLRPAAKKRAAPKKPAAKKSGTKKPATMKKAATKQGAVKKPAVKKPATKKAAEKKAQSGGIFSDHHELLSEFATLEYSENVDIDESDAEGSVASGRGANALETALLGKVDNIAILKGLIAILCDFWLKWVYLNRFYLEYLD